MSGKRQLGRKRNGILSLNGIRLRTQTDDETVDGKDDEKEEDLDKTFWLGGEDKRSSEFLNLFVDVVSRVLDISVEAPLVGVVVDSSDIAIGFDERVLSSDDFTVALFSLVLDVTGGWIVDTVFEGVLGI